MTHTIRLRGPWQLEPLERFVPRGDGSYSSDAHELPSPCRCQMPADWGEALGGDFLGTVRYTRTFNRPTNLDPQEKVWLCVEPPNSCGVVHLNGEPLGRVAYGEGATRFDVTRLLNDFNKLAIEVRHPDLDEQGCLVHTTTADLQGGLVGEVRLEIIGE